MITDAMLRDAAHKASVAYTAYLERGYDPENQYVFPPEFEKKIERLKRRAQHPVFYKAMRRVASIILALLIAGGAWITVDTEARAAFVGWIKSVYEEFFVYRFSNEVDVGNGGDWHEPTWVPDGYTKAYETDTGTRKTIFYSNEDGQMLKFNCIYDPNETGIYVMAPDAEVTSVLVNGYAADFVPSTDSAVGNVLMWIDENNCVFHLSAFLNLDDLIKLAESVYKK